MVRNFLVILLLLIYSIFSTNLPELKKDDTKCDLDTYHFIVVDGINDCHMGCAYFEMTFMKKKTKYCTDKILYTNAVGVQKHFAKVITITPEQFGKSQYTKPKFGGDGICDFDTPITAVKTINDCSTKCFFLRIADEHSVCTSCYSNNMYPMEYYPAYFTNDYPLGKQKICYYGQGKGEYSESCGTDQYCQGVKDPKDVCAPSDKLLEFLA